MIQPGIVMIGEIKAETSSPKRENKNIQKS